MSARTKAAVAFNELAVALPMCAWANDRHTCSDHPACVVWSVLNPKPKKRAAPKRKAKVEKLKPIKPTPTVEEVARADCASGQHVHRPELNRMVCVVCDEGKAYWR